MIKLEWGGRGYQTVKKIYDRFSRFGTVPGCGGQTDGRTDTDP